MVTGRLDGDAPSNQPKVAGVFPQRNVGLEVNLSLSLWAPDPNKSG